MSVEQKPAKSLIAIAYALGSFAAFSLSDGTIKWLSARYSIFQCLFVATLVASVLVVWFVWREEPRMRAFMPRLPVLTITRAVVLTAAICCILGALSLLPITDAYAIMFAAPLIVAALSGPVLGEKVTKGHWVAIVIGFAGVLVMLRPGFQTLGLGHLLAAVATVFYAGGLLLLRVIGQRERMGALLGSIFLAYLLMTAPLAWWLHVPLTTQALLLMIGAGVMQALAHIWLILAIRAATAATVSAFQYSQLVFATAIGILVFGDWPDQWLIIGAGLVVAAGLGIVQIARSAPVYTGGREPRERRES